MPVAKCQPGCTCGKHACKPGCTCSRHGNSSRACPPGCQCGRHSDEPRHAYSSGFREKLRDAHTGREWPQEVVDARADGNRSHGHSPAVRKSPTYNSWDGMIQRCTNPKNNNWKHYGARGITVCDRWLKFENFLADMGERPPGLSIDRINNDGNYEPGNCRWATRSEQRQNQRKLPRRRCEPGCTCGKHRR